MKIEVWADIICPWCGLGIHRLRTALAQFPHRDQVEIVHHSFQLDPSFPAGTAVPVRDMLRDSKGMSDTQIGTLLPRMEAMAAGEGLQPYRVLHNTVGNTALAHELLAYATSQGKHTEAWQRVFSAYFGEARALFDAGDLVDFAEDLGLDAGGAADALATRRYRGQVEADSREATRLGATGVPFFVIDRRYGIAGAQPAGAMLDILQQAWDATAGRPQQPGHAPV